MAAEFRKMESMEDEETVANEVVLNGDDDNTPVDTSDLAAKKFEALMLRISSGSLILAVILFIAQIIIISTCWRLDPSATASGFGFIIFLVIIWFSIKKVYSDSPIFKNSKIGTFGPMGMSMRFRLRGMLEISQKISRKWIAMIGILHFLGSLCLIGSEAYLLSIGVGHAWYLGTSNGVRIGLSVVFLLTSFSCFALNFKPKRKWIHFICFVLSFSSLVCSSILISSFQSLDVNRHSDNIFDNFNEYPGSRDANFVQKLVFKNEDGKFIFPFFPWILFNIAMVTWQHVMVVVSSVMMIMCLNLWFSFKLKTNTEDNFEKSIPSFAFIGVTLIVCGLVTDVAWQVRYLTASDYAYEYSGNGVFPTLTMFFIGALTLSITSSKEHFASKNILFLASFALLTSQIFSLVGTSSDLSYQRYQLMQTGTYRTRNATHMCLTREVMNPEFCISVEKVCNGVLDFITPNSTDLGWRRNSYDNDYHLTDEDSCGSTRFLPVFIALFACGGIGLFVTMAIWALTWKSFWQTLKMIFALLNQFMFSRIPLMTSNEI